jgi:hypothetical protein
MVGMRKVFGATGSLATFPDVLSEAQHSFATVFSGPQHAATGAATIAGKGLRTEARTGNP